MKPHSPFARPLERHHGAYTRALVFRHALRGAAVCASVTTLGLLAGAVLDPGVSGSWFRLVLVVALCVAAVAWAALAFVHVRPTLAGYLEQVEARFPAVRSWVRNALDLESQTTPHTSGELARAVTSETTRRLEGLPLATLRPRVEPRRPTLAMLAALALVAVTTLVWPARISRSWQTLWDPGAAAPPVKLVVEPGSVTVTPGASLAVRARVWGTDREPRLLRDKDAVVSATAEGNTDDGAHLWRFDLTQLTREHTYKVRVASSESPRYRISLTGEPAPVSFDVEYHAPDYARLPMQRGAAARGDLSALKGSRAKLVVTFDRDLASLSAQLPDGSTSRWTEITPRRWRGEVAIDRDGEYQLHAESDRETTTPGQGDFRYRITALADAPPVIAVRVPTGDMDLPSGQQIPVDLLVQDDLGLSKLELQYHKDATAAWTPVPLQHFPGRPREARLESRWDASALGLLPGQVATFRFMVQDNNVVSGPGRAYSPSFELRFPSLADLYDNMENRENRAVQSLEKAKEQVKELQQSLEKLSRQPAKPNPTSPQTFERSEEFKTALERQQEISQKISEATQNMRQNLEEAAERQSYDQQLMRKLQELNELMKQIQSQEFKDAMKKMQEAMERLDRRELEQDLPQWRQQNQEMMQNVERTVELLKKLREEEKLQSLAQRAQELKAQQDALNQQHEAQQQKNDAGQNKTLAEQQKRAAEESEQLAKEAREASQSSEEKKQEEQLDKAADDLQKEAAPSQRQASQSSSQNQPSKASQSGKQASEALQKAAERLSETARESQQQQDALDLAAVRRAAQDLVSLQRSTEQNMASPDPARDKADRQTDLSEGTARVADSLYQLSRQTPFISPQLSEALGRAINNLSQSGKEMANGNRARGEQTGRTGSESLNEAVLQLRAAEGSMCQNPGQGKPGGKQNPRKLGEVGQKQSQLNQQSRSLAQRLSQQMRLSSGDRSEMQRMAEEQARIRQQLEEIRKDEESRRELLGKLDDAGREMKEVEEALRNGSSEGSLEEKQQRILSRLLDAERSIHRRDFDPQRESRPGEDIVRSSPAELPRELLQENDRLRLDLLKAELDRYPAQYRAFVEAYLRSLNGARR